MFIFFNSNCAKFFVLWLFIQLTEPISSIIPNVIDIYMYLHIMLLSIIGTGRLLSNPIASGLLPAFHARLSRDLTNIGLGHPIVFDLEIVDTTHSYEPADGIFTVPVTIGAPHAILKIHRVYPYTIY